MLQLVGIKAPDELLPGMDDDFARHRNPPEAVDGARIQLKRALVLEFLDDVLLDLGERALGVDEVIMEDLLELLEGLPGLLLEDSVPALGEVLVEVRRPLLH